MARAMASGLPIISTDVGGVADIVTNNGILVPPKDKKALTDAIIELATNQEERRNLGKYSYENSKKYDSTEFITQYENLYNKYCI